MAYTVVPTVAIVDDDADLLSILEFQVAEWGYQVYCAKSHSQLQCLLAQTPVDLLLLDLQIGQDCGLKILSELMRSNFRAPTIILTAHGSIETAVQAIKLGAYDYLGKPPNLEHLKLMVQRAIDENRRKLCTQEVDDQAAGFFAKRPMLGVSPKMKRLQQVIADAGPSNATVMILGESGTGKELVARAIHEHSPRSKGMFVPVNMAALPANLAEAMLFGHEKGAFTGAERRQEGWCELAHNGTLFLDEIGEMDFALQAKLLRFLQERQIQRVGSNRHLQVDVRIVTATNRDPLQLVREGRLREDLYYRLNVLPIQVPPLRDRCEDIAMLAKHFMERAADANGKHVVGIHPEVIRVLERYTWPGNVRELENLMQRLVILSANSNILAQHLPPECFATIMEAESLPAAEAPEPDGLKRINRLEKQAIQEALDNCERNVVQAAEFLGLGQATLYRKIKRYGIALRPRGSSNLK
jgi:DNA-binding NtrC family response regulator